MDTQLVLTVISPLAAVVAILFVVGRATGGPRNARLENSTAVTAVRDADHTFPVGEATMTTDGQAALIANSQNGPTVAVAYVNGDRIAARVLTHREIRHLSWSAASEGTVTLRIRLLDFGCPELVLPLRKSDADLWRSRIESLFDADSFTTKQAQP